MSQPEYRAIHKHVLIAGARNEIALPLGAEVLTVHAQGDNICLWYKCDPSEEELVAYTVWVHPTGVPFVEYDAAYIGTVFLYNQSLVFHIFME